jgi:hypothetical protein
MIKLPLFATYRVFIVNRLHYMFQLNSHLTTNPRSRQCFLFPSSGEGRETPTLLGPLERANSNHWMRLALSMGPYRVGVTSPLAIFQGLDCNRCSLLKHLPIFKFAYKKCFI